MTSGSSSPHIKLQGQLIFKNTFGYINAELWPFLRYYPVMTVIYLCLFGAQVYMMKKHRENIINLHYYVLAIITICLFQCIFNWALYGNMNKIGVYSPVLTFASIAVEILRNTFARVVTLVVALGYGILITTIERYKTKILSLSFLYMASFAAYNGIQYINHYSPVSGAVALIVSFPLSILNCFFGFWIYSAFRRTLHYLVQKEQSYKYNLISKLFVSICVCLICSFFLFLAEIFVLITY